MTVCVIELYGVIAAVMVRHDATCNRPKAAHNYRTAKAHFDQELRLSVYFEQSDRCRRCILEDDSPFYLQGLPTTIILCTRFS